MGPCREAPPFIDIVAYLPTTRARGSAIWSRERNLRRASLVPWFGCT